MKFVIQRDRLLASIQDVVKAISSRTAIPILTGMKIEAKEDGITLTGSDSDISIESFIPKEEDGIVYVEQIEPGSIVLQAKYFPEIVRKVPMNAVEIESDAQLNVTIRSGSAEFKLNGQDAEEYPQLPKLHSEDSFELPADLLKNVIKETVFAVSTQETRPLLTGVNVRVQEDQLHFVATDSHRLASRQIPVSTNEAALGFQNVVIPGKSLTELNKILDENQDPVEIRITNNQILFRTKHLYFLSRLLEGNYPDTSRLIPSESKTSLLIDTKELLRSIDRASLLAKENRNNVVKLVTQDSEQLEISSNSPEVGRVVEEVTVQEISGEELRISFSAKYMMDALKVIESEQVKIEFTGAMRPFLIRPTDDEDLLQLITPVRTY
ncbi:DNA polymerase III subunit beta [Terribacillus saccharophilus]|uniref:Beta sliding clamp n=1 Tax=Terribacillus saccharophilus TaxID=361277 RepID=A0A268A729_9BACI|nr:DNA polymerase III subunit beta [Terribacillus saccharophilus]PAD19924.1 DNA polymerase III subunit beta [Terribacillus saccharophilus]PAF17164.1 DNA polymerase III subunit beta [Terribacillus saccharophilus]PAF20470.1 DNA polymerase III subunit beta [Terribacillus saccharophilus]PAF35364.1 DNA polymerase III subunit beta [Terribacillus saccharophilus]PAF38168.1 DNA polymerase III subunit beta [Terribacillus saccharophilus]